MKSEKVILIALPLVAAVIGLWVLVISPKKTEAGDLKEEAAALETELAEAETAVADGEAARSNFSKNYGELVALGAAAPEDDDQATLVYDLSRLGTQNNLRFSLFEVSDAVTAEAPAAPAPTTPAPEATGETAADTSTTATTAPAPATEASAATLPIGATVGSAGLPIMSYNFQLNGSFFGATDYLKDMTSAVDAAKTPGGKPRVNGRLLTIDGFSFVLDQLDDFPEINANYTVTSYIVPPEQGLQAGATPAGPAPVGAPETAVPVTGAPQPAAVTP